MNSIYFFTQIWDLASGQLKLSLTGHISTVRGVVVSPRQPYLFSCAEDKTVKCWDLEYNKVGNIVFTVMKIFPIIANIEIGLLHRNWWYMYLISSYPNLVFTCFSFESFHQYDLFWICFYFKFYSIQLSCNLVFLKVYPPCNMFISSHFQVIRHYHGHLSACHAIDLHPTIDILTTCGRDSTVRVSESSKLYSWGPFY